jgi:hypothetical protein
LVSVFVTHQHFSGWSNVSDNTLMMVALALADVQGTGSMEGDNLMIDGVVVADRDGMTLAWVKAVWVVVEGLEDEE